MYRSVVRRVLVNGELSEDFNVDLGVPQGAVLSPLLYAAYINGLHAALRAAGCGLWVYGRLVPLLFYADDIVLLAENADEMATSLRVLEDYARKWRFAVNHGKSNLVVVASRDIRAAATARQWRLAGKLIKVVSSYKYLGLELDGSSTRKDLRGKWNEVLARLASKGRSCLSLMMYRGGGANGLRPRTNVHHWKTCCRPILEYGCEIWEGEISVSLSDRLEAIQNYFCRATLAARDKPAVAAMRADLGLPLAA